MHSKSEQDGLVVPEGWRSYQTLKGLTVAEGVIRFLESEGVEAIFGIPGGNISPFMRALYKHRGIPFVISSHEGGAAFMADGYARATGKLGVCLTTAGPGATNALTGIACANADQVPVLVISGQVPTDRYGMGAIQESTDEGQCNTVEIYRHVTAYSTSIVDSRSFARLFTRALGVAHSMPQGAVHVSFPANVSNSRLDQLALPAKPGAYRQNLPAASKVQVRTVFELLRGAKRPLLYLGSGAREALAKHGGGFTEFVHNLGIPVATSMRAKGIFSEADPLSLGVMGIAGSKWAERYMAEGVDVLVVLGSSLGEWASKGFSRVFKLAQVSIQVDVRPEVIGRFLQVDLPIVADTGSVLAELYALGHAGGAAEGSLDARARYLAALRESSKPMAPSQEGALKPQQLMSELNDLLSGHMDLYVDMGNCTGWATHCLRVVPPVRFFCPTGFSSMGWACGAAIGGKVGRAQNSAIALVGDGAFLMNGTELATAARNRVGVVYLVFNDNYLGMVNHGEHAFNETLSLDDPLYSLGSPDLVKFAQAFGADGYLVERPGQLTTLLPGVLQRAEEARVPQVIVARIDHREPPPYADRFASIINAAERER